PIPFLSFHTIVSFLFSITINHTAHKQCTKDFAMSPLTNPSGPPNPRDTNAGGYAFSTQAALERHLADVRAKEEALKEAMRKKNNKEEEEKARAKAQKEIEDACATELAKAEEEARRAREEKLQECSNSSSSWARRRAKKRKTREQVRSAKGTGVIQEQGASGVQGESVEQADQAVTNPSDLDSPDHHVSEAGYSNSRTRFSELSSYATSSRYSQDDEALPPSGYPFASTYAETVSPQISRYSENDEPITPSENPFESFYAETISQQGSVHMSKRTSAQSGRSSNRSTVRNKGKGKRKSATSISSRACTSRRHSSRLVSNNTRKPRAVFSGSSPMPLRLPQIVASEQSGPTIGVKIGHFPPLWESNSASDMIRRASHRVARGLGGRKYRSEEMIRHMIEDSATNAKVRMVRSLNFPIGQAIATPDEKATIGKSLSGPKKDVQRRVSSSSEEANYFDAPEQAEPRSLTYQPGDDGFAHVENPEQSGENNTAHEIVQSEHTVIAPVEQPSVPEPAYAILPQGEERPVPLPSLCNARDSTTVYEEKVNQQSPDRRSFSKVWLYIVPSIVWLAVMLGLCAFLVQSHHPLSSPALSGVYATKGNQTASKSRSLSISARFLEPSNLTILNTTSPNWHTFTHAQNYTLSVPWPVYTIAAFLDQRNRNQVQQVLFNIFDEMKQIGGPGQNGTGTVIVQNEIGQPITFPVPGVHDEAILQAFLSKVFGAMARNTSIYSTGVSSGNHTSLNASKILTPPHLQTQPFSALNQTWIIILEALTRPNATGLFAELAVSATHSLDLNTVCPKMEAEQKKCECRMPPVKCPKPKPKPSTIPKGSKGNATERDRDDDDVVDSEDEEMETESPSMEPTILFVRNMITGMWVILLAAGLFWAGCYLESRVAGLRYEWQWIWGFSMGIIVISLLGSAGLGLGTQALTEVVAVKISG
ncbi:hypothetical protein BKA63DRAFT_577176, partial [Paraphoma chrysanthemicola]